MGKRGLGFGGASRPLPGWRRSTPRASSRENSFGEDAFADLHRRYPKGIPYEEEQRWKEEWRRRSYRYNMEPEEVERTLMTVLMDGDTAPIERVYGRWP